MTDDVLYSKSDAEALTQSEKEDAWRLETDQLKADLISRYAGDLHTFVEIGCGWGQVLRNLVGRFPVLIGVDESADRLESLRNNTQGIQTVQCSADHLPWEDEYCDGVLTSHVMHEIKLFGDSDEMQRTLTEIRRVMMPQGQYFIIDHRDPGKGDVVIELPEEMAELLRWFARKYLCRKVQVRWDGLTATLDRQDCHDFVTKIWAMGGGAEDLEMKESHTVMQKDDLINDIRLSGLILDRWETFNPITRLMEFYGIRLVEGGDWDRQFLLVARKSDRRTG